MKRKKINNKLLELPKSIFVRLFKINDTPQKIALGFGLGVFLGIMPGSGPIASLFLASILKVNRASALFGSLLTNTWLSIVTFLLSIKVGAYLMHLDWQGVYNGWILVLKDFHWVNLFKITILKIILPVILGYIIVSFFIGLIAYLIAFATLSFIRHRKALSP